MCDEETKGDPKSREEWSSFIPHGQLARLSRLGTSLRVKVNRPVWIASPTNRKTVRTGKWPVSYSSNSQSSGSRESHLGNVTKEKF